MDFSEYQKVAISTRIYPRVGKNFIYPVLGITGEAGEIADKVKKIERDNNGTLTPELAEELKKEIGDVLWYLTALASELGFTLEDAAQKNIEKVISRSERDKIHGDGDNR